MKSLVARPARWPFPRQAFVLSCGLALAMYFPCLLGRIPLPADLLGYFPVWEGVPGLAPLTRHGELGDLLTLMYPWRVVLAESLREGELPFWNPHSFVGSPFLANPISAVFYPPHVLFAVLPVGLAWSLQFPLRLALAVFFAALLARRLGASRGGALLSGCVFGLCGFMTGWQGWPQADALVWTPLGLFAVLKLRRRPGPASATLLAFALAITVLAGHPETSLYSVCTIVAFGLWNLFEVVRRGRRPAIRYVAWLAVSGALAAGICAVQLVPTAEWLPRITRRRLWPAQPARDWISLVSRDTQSNPTAAGLEFPNQGCYAGMASLLLAPLAFFVRKKGMPVFFAILGFVSFAAAFSWPPISQVFRALPVFRAMPGVRLVGITDLCLAMLAGLGFTAVERLRGARLVRIAAIGLAVAACATAATIWILRDRSHGHLIGDALRRPRFAFLLLFASFAALQAAVWSRRRPSRWLAVSAAILVFDLGTFAWRHVPLVPRAAVFPPGPVTDYLKASASNGDRVVFLDRTAFRNVEIPYGLDALDGYPQVLRQTAGLLAPLNGGSDRDEPLRQLTTEGVLAGDLSRYVLGLTAARFLVANTYTQTPERLARLGEQFPLRYSRASVRIYENEGARRLVSSPDGSCAVEGIERRVNTVSAAVACDRPAILAVAETFYPGWRADVSGKPADVAPTNEGFLSVAVPAGRGVVRLRFRPTGFAVASAVSGTSLLIALGLLLASWRGLRVSRA